MNLRSFFNAHRLSVFFPAAVTAALLALVWTALRLALTSPDLSLPFKLAALLISAAACLIIGLGGLWSFIRLRKGLHLLPASLGAALGIVYLAPFLALLLPEWLAHGQHLSAPAAVQALFSPPTTTSWIFVYLYQAFLLGVFSIRYRGAGALPSAEPPAPGSRFWQGLLSVCPGAAVWLTGQFIFQLLLPHFNLPALGVADAPLLLKALISAAALLVMPWTSGRFFFFLLRTRFGAEQGLLFALLFAVLQFRPAVFIPAFLFALCAREIAVRTGRLTPVAAAYTVFNLLMLLFNWNLVI